MTRFIVCKNPTCRAVVEVRSAYYQKRRKFCSKRCNGIMTGAKNIPREARSRGGHTSRQIRQAAAMARLAGLSPVEIWRQAYRAGWKTGRRRAA